jgi:hypothetical protein
METNPPKEMHEFLENGDIEIWQHELNDWINKWGIIYGHSQMMDLSIDVLLGNFIMHTLSVIFMTDGIEEKRKKKDALEFLEKYKKNHIRIIDQAIEQFKEKMKTRMALAESFDIHTIN